MMNSSKISNKIWTVTEILKATKDFLDSKGLDDARVCAEAFVMDAMGIKKRHELYIMFDSIVSVEEKGKIRNMMKRRVAGEPVQYIIGKVIFYSFDFNVDGRALIPREETEYVIDMFEKYIQDKIQSELSVLDLCTGSGVIGITLKNLFPDVKIVISDISEEAISLAKENINLNKIENMDTFVGDGLKHFETNTFDIIVSNPPYILDGVMAGLDREVKEWEPHLALEAGLEGLDFFRDTKNDVIRTLKSGGLYIFEYGGFDQTDKIIEMYETHFEVVEVVKDFNEIDRVIVLRKQ